MKCRCQNEMVRDAVERGMTVVLRFRLDTGGLIAVKMIRVDFSTQMISLHEGWNEMKPYLESRPHGGEWFRDKSLYERKNTWDAGFNSAVRAARVQGFLFIGKQRVNRFTGWEDREPADSADCWHWQNVCDAALGLRVFVKNDPSPVWPRGRGRRDDWEDAKAASARWHERRAAFFREKVHPKLLGSLGYFADVYGDVPSYVVTGGRSDLCAYVRKQQRSLNFHRSKDATRRELWDEIMRGEWPSVATRICERSPIMGSIAVPAVAKSIRRAGAVMTKKAQAWFRKFHAISLLGGWARREQEARQQLQTKKATS